MIEREVEPSLMHPGPAAVGPEGRRPYLPRATR